MSTGTDPSTATHQTEQQTATQQVVETATATPAQVQTPETAQTTGNVSPNQQTSLPPTPAPDPLWLPKRLDQERRNAFKSLGVKDAEEAKALIAKAKQAEEAGKAKQQQDQAQAEILERYRKAVQAQADRALSTLSPAQQSYVMKRAGDDPAKLLDEIDDLRTLLSFNAPAPVAPAPAVHTATEAAPPAPAVQAPKAPLPAPATTSAPAAAPKQNVQPPTDHYATWQRLKSGNPLQANAYYEKNERAINAQIESRRKQQP